MNVLRRIGVGNTSVSGVRVMPLRVIPPPPCGPGVWLWLFYVFVGVLGFTLGLMVAMLRISYEVVVNLESKPRVEVQGRLNTVY